MNRRIILSVLVAALAPVAFLDGTRSWTTSASASPPEVAAHDSSAPNDPPARETLRNEIESRNAANNVPTIADASTEPGDTTDEPAQPAADQAPQVDDEELKAAVTSASEDHRATSQRLNLQPLEAQEQVVARPDGANSGAADPRAPILSSRRLSYQAVLTDNAGNALPGPTVNLAFRIYTSAAVLVEGPINVPNVPINDGVVDTSFPVSVGTFDGSDRLLGVTVNAGAELAPRIQLTTVPYALRVDRVLSEELDDNIALGRGAAPLASGSLSVQNGAIAQPTIVLSGSSSAISTYGSDGLEQIRLHGTSWGEILLNDSSATNDQTVVLSATSNSGGQLTLRNSDASQIGVFLEGDDAGTNDGGKMTVNQADGTIGILLDGDSSNANGGAYAEMRAGDGSIGIALDGDSGGAGLLQVRDTNGSTRVTLDGDASSNAGGGLVTVLQADGSSGVTIDGDASNANTGGALSVHDNISQTRVQLLGESIGTGGEISVFDDDGTETIELLGAASATEGGQILIRNAAGTSTVLLDGDSGDAAFVALRNTVGSNRVTLDGDSGGAGLISLYQNDGSTGVTIDADAGTNVGGLISVRDSASATRVSIDGESVGTGGEISVFDDNGTETVEILGAETTTTGSQILLRDSSGVAQIELDGEFGSTGDPGRIITPVLQITGGSDLSEDFDVAGDSVIPGMVVCIDENNPGKLVVSTAAYDRRVAGVVSGANGIRTGLLMGQKRAVDQPQSIADGKLPIALTGRVYCLVDATQAEVVPGDLLTTSNRPGHAMKAADHSRAQGAIIGKAMTRLAQGQKGMVLVLVSMQ